VKLPPDRRFAVIVRLFAAFASDDRGDPDRSRMGVAGRLRRLFAPLALRAVFYLVLAPVGALQRLAGRRAMHRKIDPDAQSYWIRRTPLGPSPESFRNEF
jgi:hypothetical protein